MSLFLAYHDATTLVVASDRRSVICNEMGKVLTGTNDTAKFVTLPNGIVVVALGRADLALRLRNGTVQLASEHPHLRFSQLADAYEEVMGMMFSKRKTPRDSDLLVGALCGWDAEVGHMRTVSWHSAEKFARWEKYFPDLNITALGVVHLNTKAACDHLAAILRSVKPQEKTPAIVAKYLRSAVRSVAKNHADLVSPQAYFAAFEKNQRVTLPVEFELPPLMADAARAGASLAVSGEGRFFVGSIMTPVAGGDDTVGNNDGGVAAQFGQVLTYNMTENSTTAVPPNGNGAIVDPSFAIDGDNTTYAKLTATGNGSGNSANLVLSGPPALSTGFQNATLKITYAVPVNSLPALSIPLSVSISYCLDGQLGVVGSPVQIVPGVTQAKTTVSVNLPTNQNLGLVQVIAAVTTFGVPNAPSGSVELDLYDAHLEAAQ